MIWIEGNGRVSHHEQWHESKMNHLLRDDLIMYAKVDWARVVKICWDKYLLGRSPPQRLR